MHRIEAGEIQATSPSSRVAARAVVIQRGYIRRRRPLAGSSSANTKVVEVKRISGFPSGLPAVR
jgi:hypothetical protein